MTPNFRALCAELLAALEEEASNWNLDPEGHPLVARARAALAEPVPQPEGPTDQEIEALHHAVFSSRLHGPPPNTSFEVDLVRAALARWGQP